MADYRIGGATYGARFEALANNSAGVSFVPYVNTANRNNDPLQNVWYLYQNGAAIHVGTVGTGGTASTNYTWNFRDYNPTQVARADMPAVFRQAVLAADNPFFFDGNRLTWFEKFFSRFETNPFRVVMPTAGTLEIDFGDIITGFEVDSSVRPPVVNSITTGTAKIIFTIDEIGGGGVIPDGTIYPSGTTNVANLDANVRGTVVFHNLYNTSFSWTNGAATTNVGILPDFTRNFNFAAVIN